MCLLIGNCQSVVKVRLWVRNRNTRISWERAGGNCQSNRKSGLKHRRSERGGMNKGIPESGNHAKIWGLRRKDGVAGQGNTKS